jgi:hypothetical protein
LSRWGSSSRSRSSARPISICTTTKSTTHGQLRGNPDHVLEDESVRKAKTYFFAFSLCQQTVFLWVFILAFVTYQASKYLLVCVIDVDRLAFSTLRIQARIQVHRCDTTIIRTSKIGKVGLTRFQVLLGSLSFSFPLFRP